MQRSLLLTVALLGTTLAGCGGESGGPNPTLSVDLAGSGRGTVLGSPGGINCTSGTGPGSETGTCQAAVDQGTQITLSATPESESSFSGWGGNGVSCPANAPCAITVNESRTVTATFGESPTTRELTVVGGGAGTGSGVILSDPEGIECTITSGTADGPTCSASFTTGESVQLQIQSGSLVGWGGACSGATCSVVMSEDRTVIATFTAEAAATQLAFVVQPSAVQTGNPISPAVQVAVQDADGQTLAGRTDAITLQIGTNPGGATLGGQVTRNAVSGVATFSDLTLDQVGTDYTLTASATGLTGATSAAFNVSAEPVAQLAFSVQPTTTAAGAAIDPAVTVEIRDQSGAVLTARTDQITISLQQNPGGGALVGSTTAAAVAGVATFSNLTLQKAADGYRLAASTANAAGASSDEFEIVAGPPVLVTRNSVETQEAPVGTDVPVRPSVMVVDAFNNPVQGVVVSWVVTAGGGSVVASTNDPVDRPTGPLGLSTAVSWTLGPEVGVENNELRATVSQAGVNGSPIFFTASGTIPAGQGIFTGVLKEVENVGFVTPAVPIGDATLQFVNLSDNQVIGSATSRSDGSFTSPPLPGGNPFRINVTADDYKDITYQKPAVPANTTVSLGDLGMVPFDDAQGTSGMAFTVRLSDTPAASVNVHVDVYPGYYVGETDESLIINDVDVETTVDDGEAEIVFDPIGEWGPLTIRITAPGYEPEDRFVVVDEPVGFNDQIPDIELDPAQ